VPIFLHIELSSSYAAYIRIVTWLSLKVKKTA